MVGNPATQSLVLSAPKWLLPELRAAIAACDEVALPDGLVVGGAVEQSGAGEAIEVWRTVDGRFEPAGIVARRLSIKPPPKWLRVAVDWGKIEVLEEARQAARVRVTATLPGTNEPVQFEVMDVRGR